MWAPARYSMAARPGSKVTSLCWPRVFWRSWRGGASVMAVLVGEWGQEPVLPEAVVRVEARAPVDRNLLATYPP